MSLSKVKAVSLVVLLLLLRPTATVKRSVSLQMRSNRAGGI